MPFLGPNHPANEVLKLVKGITGSIIERRVLRGINQL